MSNPFAAPVEYPSSIGPAVDQSRAAFADGLKGSGMKVAGVATTLDNARLGVTIHYYLEPEA